MNSNKKLICVGVITAAHGIIGQVKIKSYTEPAIQLAKYQEIFKENGDIVKINSARMAKDLVICSIAAVNNRNDAEDLRGVKLYINAELLPEIKDDSEYYIHELENLDVLDQNQQKIGQIIHILNYGAGDIIEVEFLNGDSELFPFLKELFPKVDVKAGYVILTMM